MTLPRITATLTARGRITDASGGVSEAVDRTCGRITVTSTTATFIGDRLQYTETATTASCGTWTISGTLTRGARFTPTQPPAPSVAVRPVDARFTDTFWQQFAYDAFDYHAQFRTRPLRVLDASVMRLYIATTTDTGRRMLFGNGLAQMMEWAPTYGRQLSGRNIIGEIRTGSYQEVDRHRTRNEPGWIYVLLETDLSGCGLASVGANPGIIELNANNTNCLDLEVFAHELGHALGFFHLDPSVYPNALMRTGSWQGDLGDYRFSGREKYHARLAYEVGRGEEYCGWPFQASCTRRGALRSLAPLVID